MKNTVKNNILHLKPTQKSVGSSYLIISSSLHFLTQNTNNNFV